MNEITEQRKKVLVEFIMDHNLLPEYRRTNYKTMYMFIRYNYLSEFRKWLKDKPFKHLFIKGVKNEIN